MSEPTNGELAIMIKDLDNRSNERHGSMIKILDRLEEKGDRTLEQAQKTNGRVNRHDWQFKAAWWALGALWVLLVMGLPIAWTVLKTQIRIISEESSQKAIGQLEDKYDFKSAK